MSKDLICNARDPEDPGSGVVEVRFPGDLLDRVLKHSEVKYRNIAVARFVLDVENTECIFAGIRDHNKGGWCYTGRPEEWCVRPQCDASFPSHFIYAVYVNPRLHAFEWRAEVVSDDDPSSPMDWQERFRGLLWKRGS